MFNGKGVGIELRNMVIKTTSYLEQQRCGNSECCFPTKQKTYVVEEQAWKFNNWNLHPILHFKSQLPPFYLIFLCGPSCVFPPPPKRTFTTAIQQISTGCMSTDCMQFPSYLSLHLPKHERVNTQRPVGDGFKLLQSNPISLEFGIVISLVTTLSSNNPIFRWRGSKWDFSSLFLSMIESIA